MMAVARHLKEPIIEMKDCLPRWSRTATRSEFVHSGPITNFAALADMDEDKPTTDSKQIGQKARWQEVRKINRHIESYLSELPPSEFWDALASYAAYVDAYFEKLTGPDLTPAMRTTKDATFKSTKNHQTDMGTSNEATKQVARSSGTTKQTSSESRTSSDSEVEESAAPETIIPSGSQMVPKGRSKGRPKVKKGDPNHNRFATRAGEESTQPAKKKLKTQRPDINDRPDDHDTVHIIHGIRILASEMARVSSNQTVSSTIVWGMSELMKRSAGDNIDGFVSRATLFNNDSRGLDLSKNCVQLHFNDTNHFFTSFWDSGKQSLYLCDSLAMELTWQARLQLWRLYSRDGQPLRFSYLAVQNQRNGVDCAFFAAAFAYELACRNGDPRDTSYKGSALREWVSDCFRQAKLAPPPRNPGRKAQRVCINFDFHTGLLTAEETTAKLHSIKDRRNFYPP